MHKGWAILLLAASPSALAQESGTPAPQPASAWRKTFNIEARHYRWDADKAWPYTPAAGGGEGYQLDIPFGLSLSGPLGESFNLDFVTRSGWYHSKQTSGFIGESKGLTDTSVSGTATYLKWRGVQPYLGLSFNLPTGDTDLSGTKATAPSDPDVAELGTFGEGFNFGSTLGANIPLSETLIVALGLGYTYRGEFSRTGVDPLLLVPTTTQLDPGDVITLNTSIGKQGEKLSVQAALSYTTETKTTLDGTPFYRSGDYGVLSLSGGWAWDSGAVTKVSSSFSLYQKNRIAALGASSLVKETFNSNSTVYSASLDTTWTVKQWALAPVVSWLYRDHNSWDPTALQYVSAKTSWTFGASAQRALTDHTSVSLSLDRQWLRQDENAVALLPQISTDSLQFSIGGSYSF